MDPTIISTRMKFMRETDYKCFQHLLIKVMMKLNVEEYVERIE